MKDKKELSKVISALTDAVNALNGFVAEEDEEPVEPEVNELETFTVEEPAPAVEEAPVADEAEAVEEKPTEEPVEEPEEEPEEEVDEGILGTGLALAGAGAALGAGAAVGNKVTNKLMGEELDDDDAEIDDDEEIEIVDDGDVLKDMVPCMCEECGWEGYIAKKDYDGCCPRCHAHTGEVEEVEEGLLDIVKAPVKAIGSVVSGVGNALTGLGEECEECKECNECDECDECDDTKDESLLGTAALTGLVGGAAGAVGKKVMGKVLGEDAEEDPEIAKTTGEQVKQVATMITDYFKSNSEPNNKKAEVAAAVVDAVPAELVDDLVRETKKVIGDKQITDDMHKKFAEKGIDSTPFNKFSDLMDGILKNDTANKAAKPLVLTILGIISVIEPTPVGEIITAIVSLIPADKFLKILLTGIGLGSPLLMIPTIMYWVNKFKANKEQPVEEAVDDDDDVAIKFDDDVEFDECVNEDASLTEAKISDFEDKFGFYVSPRIAEDVFYRDAYILIEPTEAAAAGCEVIYVDADQMIYLYNEGTDNDEYSHYVHSDLDVHSEIKHILQTQLDLAFDEIANVRVVKGKYYR